MKQYMTSPPPQQTSKPKKHLSIFLLFSLFALALLHLAFYGLHILCIRPVNDPFLSTTEQTPHQNLRILQDSTPKFPTRKKIHSDSLLSSLQHPRESNHFSIKATKFFTDHPCDLKFFMTWISNADSFGPRELVSIESLFKSHPNACLLIVSTSLDSPTGIKLLQPLLSRGFHIAALSPDFSSLFKNTPAELWFANLIHGRINPGEVSLGQNLSNLLRLVLLYKFGGIYIDTDVIILKSLSGLKNAIGAQAVDTKTGNWSRLNNAVMIFDKGHPLLDKFLEEFARTFDGNRWGHNGPYLVSRVVSSVAGMGGFEFTVLPPPAFYPVGWNGVKGLFEGPRGGYHSKWVNAKFEGIRRESYGLHLWNRESRRLEVEEASVVGRIVRECCVLCNFSVSDL